MAKELNERGGGDARDAQYKTLIGLTAIPWVVSVIVFSVLLDRISDSILRNICWTFFLLSMSGVPSIYFRIYLLSILNDRFDKFVFIFSVGCYLVGVCILLFSGALWK